MRRDIAILGFIRAGRDVPDAVAEAASPAPGEGDVRHHDDDDPLWCKGCEGWR